MKKKIFLNGTTPPELERPRSAGLRFIPRSKPSAPSPTGSATAAARRTSNMKTQRVSCGRSDDGTMRVMLTIAAVLALILIFSVFYAAGRPKPLPPVAAPHLATDSGTQSRPQERMWMKEYMEQNGPSEELKARRARMGRFQQTGNGSGGG